MYMSFHDAVEELTTEEKGILMDAVFKYHAGVDLPELPKLVKMVFSIMRKQFERDAAKYQKIVARNRDNGGKGGRPPQNPKKPTGPHWDPKNHDDDADDDSDAKNENENDDDSDADPATNDRDLKIIKDNYYKYFLKKESNPSKISESWRKARKKKGVVNIMETLRKAWTSTYLREKADLSFMLDNLDSIEAGKYDNKDGPTPFPQPPRRDPTPPADQDTSEPEPEPVNEDELPF